MQLGPMSPLTPVSLTVVGARLLTCEELRRALASSELSLPQPTVCVGRDAFWGVYRWLERELPVLALAGEHPMPQRLHPSMLAMLQTYVEKNPPAWGLRLDTWAPSALTQMLEGAGMRKDQASVMAYDMLHMGRETPNADSK